MDFDTVVSVAKPVIMNYALPMLVGTVIIAVVMSFLKK